MRRGEDRLDTLILSSELAWSLNPDHKLSFSPDACRVQSVNSSLERRQSDAAPTDTLEQSNRQPLNSYSLPLLWSWKVNAESRLKVRLNTGWNSIGIDNTLLDARAGNSVRVVQKNEQREAHNHFLDVDYSTEYTGGHEVAAGIKLARNRRSSSTRI